MCACPGSKTTHIATNFMRGRGVLVACERNRGKLKRLNTLSRALGMERCIVPTLADSTACVYADARVDKPITDGVGAAGDKPITDGVGAAGEKPITDTVVASGEANREVGAATAGAQKGAGAGVTGGRAAGGEAALARAARLRCLEDDICVWYACSSAHWVWHTPGTWA